MKRISECAKLQTLHLCDTEHLKTLVHFLYNLQDLEGYDLIGSPLFIHISVCWFPAGDNEIFGARYVTGCKTSLN